MRDLTHLGQQAEDSLLADGVYALSVFCGTLEQGETLDERLAEVVEEAPIPNSQIRVSTAGRLRAEGFRLEQFDEPASHYNVILAEVPSPEAITRFVAAFDPPRRNPR